ncbi:MAG: hypothetical protein ACJ735_11965 [Actinomycetes bacterium]
MVRVVLAVVSAAVALTGTAAVAAPSRPAPYAPPPFAADCHFRYFGEGVAPPVRGYKDDPLCVDYAKRDITVDNGGAVRFTRAEPARFAIATKPCQYWQVDHWSVQLDRGFTPVVRWDGSYWFDKGRGTGAVLMRNFRIAGQPVGAAQAASAVATVSPPLAAQIRKYGEGSGKSGGGMSFNLGGGDPQCKSR